MRNVVRLVLSAVFVLTASSQTTAQPFPPLVAGPPPPPPPPPPVVNPWTQTASAGLALTSGNKDTSTLNLGYEVIYDPKARNLIRSDGLFLRGRTDGELTADRLAINGRDEFKVEEHAFVFGQVQFLRDQFKDIDYLVSPTLGLGYRLVDKDPTRISFDAGLGGVWERSLDGRMTNSGAITLAEKLSHRLSSVATVTQSMSALYKTADFNDALYQLGAAITASITTRTQLKVEVLDTFKNQVAEPLQKNDVAVIVGMVFKR